MATLGLVRNGVLGFLDTYLTSTLNNLLEPGGFFAESLHPVFKHNDNHGYVLIVGETEIVPAYNTEGFDVRFNGEPEGTTHKVRHHDQWYASTASPVGTPELNLGRIIGNSAEELSIPIETSIAVSQGWGGDKFTSPGSALLIAGLGNDENETDSFFGPVNNSAQALNNKGWITLTGSLIGDNPFGDVRDWLDEAKPDLIHLNGHGNYNIITQFSPINPPNLAGKAPVVFASSCLTGNYEIGNDVGIAETFLQQGAGVYIGSTEDSAHHHNGHYSEDFYSDYWVNGDPVGRSFALMEKNKWGNSNWSKFWIVEYNFYGDPKFGSSSPSGSSTAMVQNTPMSLPDGTLHVSVPNYSVQEDTLGNHQVKIPGGEMILEEGVPSIPFWIETIDYPSGYRVKNVTLRTRSGLEFGTNLNLPIVEMNTSSNNQNHHTQVTTHSTDDEAWYLDLERIFEWEVFENPDGSSSLWLAIYPFHYQPLTTNYEWYNAFTFDIEVVETGARIELLTLDKGAYAPGEQLIADLWLNNTDSAADLLIVPSVRSTGSEAITDGIMLDTLNGTEGVGHYILEWDSSGFVPGYYALDVELRDAEGNLLHVVEQIFEILGAVGEITHLSALPEVFTPGDLVEIDLTVTNTGYLPLSGEVTIEVQTSDGSATLATFTHPVTDLAPADSLDFNAIWDSTGATEAEYRIIGYMRYETRYSNIATVVVTNASSDPENKIYLPLIVR